MSYYRKSEDTHPSILQRFRCKIICEHLLCKQAEIQSKSLFWLRFRISDEAKYVPKMFLLRWAAQIDQRCVPMQPDRKSTRLNSSHLGISYAVFCLKKKK